MICAMRTHCPTPLFPLIASVLLGACADSARDWQHSGATMGTGYSVTVADCPPDFCNLELAKKIEAELQKINVQMSHYDSDSELSRFNKLQSTKWQTVSPELASVVDRALAISALSGGVFDVTVAPSVNAWGFGPQDGTGEAPSDEVVAAAVLHSGWEKVRVRIDPPELRKTDPMLALDLSAIAKGFAVDRLAYLLEFTSLQNYLVEIGGELRTSGLRSDGKPWRIGIERPGPGLDIDFLVTPGDNSVATSGDYRNYQVIDGKRFSHAIDPRTGSPVAGELASVTVIDRSAATADALATTLMVMGTAEGTEFAARNNIPALFIVREADAFRPIVTAEFEPYLAFD